MPDNIICQLCRQTDHAGDKLRQIENFIRKTRIQPVKINNYRYDWFSEARCRYHIPCNKLNSYNRENDRIEKHIEPYITAIAESGNKTLIHELLNLLRGDYPSVYHMVDIISHKTKT